LWKRERKVSRGIAGLNEMIGNMVVVEKRMGAKGERVRHAKTDQSLAKSAG
jgi:hypothetical protein